MKPMLSAASYRTRSHFELEQRALFARTWVNTGSASRVAQTGDVCPVSVAGMPLVLARGSDGALHVFHNVCRHRGARVVREPCRRAKRLRCPYHGWAYGLDGVLRGTPHWRHDDGSAPVGFDAANHALEPVRFAVWLDQIFVNLDGQAPPFDEFVAPLTSRWANYDLERLRLGEQRRLEVNANWKFVVENYLDTYHLPMVHPQLGDIQSARRFEDVNLDDRVFGICYTTGAADKPKSSAGTLAKFDRLSPLQQVGQDVLALFPNTLIEMQPHHLMLVTIEACGPAHTVEHLNFYFVAESACAADLAPARAETGDAWELIMGQDMEVLADLQAASHSPVADRVAGMSPVWEVGTARFRASVARAMALDLPAEGQFGSPSAGS